MFGKKKIQELTEALQSKEKLLAVLRSDYDELEAKWTQAQDSLRTQHSMLRDKEHKVDALRNALCEAEDKVIWKQEELKYKEIYLTKRDEQLADKEASLLALQSSINSLVREKISKTILDLSRREYLSSTPAFQSIRSSPDPGRIISSLTQDMNILPPFDIIAKIHSESGETYDVSLSSCTCRDFILHKSPCKHMYRLASEVGALLSLDSEHVRDSLSADLVKFQEQAEKQKRESEKAKAAAKKAAKRIAEARTLQQGVEKLINESTQTFPWLSTLYADYILTLDDALEKELRSKRPPAKSSADKVRQIKTEKRALQKRCKALEYQLNFYKAAFPMLEEFEDVPPVEAYEIINGITADDGTAAEYDQLKSWLTPEEYHKLSETEKLQLTLDRYKSSKKKSKWQVGIDYERYIGYLAEQEGCRVEYSGAKLRLEDMGRDLILRKGFDTWIVQCKRWAKEKTIHEKHIFQLFGSCILYEAQSNPTMGFVKGIFVTTATLSPVARKCADRLGIMIFEEIPYNDYPMIKCNIGKEGDKIYHLPFDQQYDNVIVTPESGEFYAHTVQEAEAAGFRHAWRHA